MSFLRLASTSLLVCAACGGNPANHLPDAPPLDTIGLDASPDAPAHGLVTVTVLDPANTGAPAVGIPVVFIDPDGSLVARVATDSAGKAQGDVKPGANVTIVEALANATQMQTVFAIQPGDSIVLGNVFDTSAAGSFTVNFTPIVGGAAASTYEVFGPCGSVTTTTGTAVLPMTANCKLDTMELQVFATSAAGLSQGYLDKPNVTFTPGGSDTIVGMFQTLTTFNGSWTNVPAEVTSVSLVRATPDGFGFSRSISGATAGTTLALSVPAAITTTALVTARYIGPGRALQQHIQSLAGNVTTFGLDAGGTLLAWLGAPTLDLTTARVSVPFTTINTSGDAPDLAVMEVTYQRPVATATAVFQWIAFAPAASDYTLPTLPPEVGDVNPKATDTVGISVAEIIESDSVAGYDAVRAHPAGIVGQGQRIQGTVRTSRSASPLTGFN